MSNKCEILRNGKTLAGPMLFDAGRVRDLIMRQGGDYRLVPNNLSTMVVIGSLAILPVLEDMPELTFAQTYGRPVRSENDGVVIYSYPVGLRPEDEVRQLLQARLNKVHEAYEAGRFEYQGVMLAKDIEARVNSLGVLKEFELEQRDHCVWRGKAKEEGGNARVQVSGIDEMKMLAGAIGRASAIGFDAKSAIEDMLAAAEAEDLAALDVEAEFAAAIVS